MLNLDGQCGVYTTIIQRGTHLHYTDVDGDRVTLGISHGGVLELLRAPNGEARQLYILNGSQYGQRLSPNHSFLQGSVTRRHGGDGQATISQIIGANQVQIRLKQPPFRIGALVNPTTPLPNMALPGSGILPLAARLRKHR